MNITVQMLEPNTGDFKKLTSMDIKERYKYTIYKQVCSLDWGSLKENVRISYQGKLYHDLKRHNPCFTEEFSHFSGTLKQAKFQFLKGDKLNKRNQNTFCK